MFAFLWLGSCGYALWRGGQPERFVAVIFLVAVPLCLVAYIPDPWRGVQWIILAIDSAMLVLLLAIALRANRYWTLAMAAMQLLQVLGHFLKLTDPAMLHVVYWISAVVWAYPMLLLLVLGTVRHHNRVRRLGPEPSWSNSSLPPD
ncbi:MAG: hypothetical protein E7773_14180 [Sphingomonas sp.]|nr:MAG: hypothetical protein E7773_14180 [Sphingomonas sp.]